MAPPKPLRLFRPPLRRLAILAIVAGAVVGGIVWFFGLGIPQSALIAVAVFAVGATCAAVQEADAVEWPQPPPHRTPGARRDIETLGWSMRARGGVADKSIARAREAARHRLIFLYGLDLYEPGDREAIEGLLAPSIVQTLMSPRQTNLDLNSFTRILSALEYLGRSTGRPSSPDHRSSTERHP